MGSNTNDELVPALYACEKGSSAQVLVTGASGFVAGNLVRRLLAAGHIVHATVRDVSKAEELKALPGAADRLKLFSADLLSPGGFDEAMQGCAYVFHTASPFIVQGINPQSAQTKLIEPALMGTKNVLDSVNRCPTVKRVVLTSSCAAVMHSGYDKPPGHVFTEEDWNENSSLKCQPYNYSKTLAEKKAWEMCKAQDRWTLVTINPPLIFGPPQTSRMDGASLDFVKDVVQNKFVGVPHMGFGVVDVRDVAAAHCVAAFTPETSGRYIVSARCTTAKEVVQTVAGLYPKTVSQPKFTIPKVVMLIVGPFLGLPRDVVRATMGTTVSISSEKATSQLGLTFIPMERSLKDMCDAMARINIIKLKD